jgi:GNAT superfamily N-acetyltransferase
MTDISIRHVTPDDFDWIVERHATLYAEQDGFDESFGPLVASILAEWYPRHDPRRERGFLAERRGDRLGTVFCVDAGEEVAKLRLFLLEPAARGQGLGRRLLDDCLGFARDAGYRRMTLWTHESHRAACALYAAAGFHLASARPVHSFGQDLVEQHWEFALTPPE